jgi:ubiquinone/menaquinone biosynthesis C-methylase UbiE
MKNFDYHEAVFENLPLSYKKWMDEEKVVLRKTVSKNAKVLEVGCGDGRSLKDIVDISSQLTGIDIDKNAVIYAKKYFKKYPSVKIFQANAKHLSFKDNTFDFVICMTSFVNFDKDKVKILKEMRKTKTAGPGPQLSRPRQERKREEKERKKVTEK